MTADEVQYALTYSQRSPFYYRSHYVVPNVHWGLGFNHELDLLSITHHFVGTETEIKVSRGDVKRDLEKAHRHYDNRVRYIYFAGQRTLMGDFYEYVPEQFGLIAIVEYAPGRYDCSIKRNAKPNENWRPFLPHEVLQLMRLGNMRYWSQFFKKMKAKK